VSVGSPQSMRVERVVLMSFDCGTMLGRFFMLSIFVYKRRSGPIRVSALQFQSVIRRSQIAWLIFEPCYFCPDIFNDVAGKWSCRTR